MIRQPFLLIAISAITLACQASPESAAHSTALAGTWRVERFCDDDSTGKLYNPFGDHPTGYLIYTSTGQVSIQMMRTPAISSFAGGDDHPDEGERKAMQESYLGYYGSYTITSDSTVVHHVKGGTLPSYNGTDQPRVFRIRGDTLRLGGSQVTWPCRVLIREH